MPVATPDQYAEMIARAKAILPETEGVAYEPSVAALEELDAPGEWYVDRENRVLYFYPPDGAVNDVVLAVQKQPLIQMVKTAHVRLEGLRFAHSTGRAVSVEGCENVLLKGLSVAQVTTDGISVSGGRNCGLDGCEVYGTGGTCVMVSGGDSVNTLPALTLNDSPSSRQR